MHGGLWSSASVRLRPAPSGPLISEHRGKKGFGCSWLHRLLGVWPWAIHLGQWPQLSHLQSSNGNIKMRNSMLKNLREILKHGWLIHFPYSQWHPASQTEPPHRVGFSKRGVCLSLLRMHFFWGVTLTPFLVLYVSLRSWINKVLASFN